MNYYLPRSGLAPITVQDCVDIAVDYIGITHDDLPGHSRHRTIVSVRELATWLSRNYTIASFPDIARRLFRPNHSSVVTMFQRVTEDRLIFRRMPHDIVGVRFVECEPELRRRAEEAVRRRSREVQELRGRYGRADDGGGAIRGPAAGRFLAEASGSGR